MKKNTITKTVAACSLCLTVLASGISASAAYNVGVQNRMGGMQRFGGQQQTQMLGGQQFGQSFGQNNQFGGMTQGSEQNGVPAMGGMNQFGGMMQNGMTQTASSAGVVVTGTTTNSAADLTADYANAKTITMSDENNEVKIKEAGTYIVTGSCSNGNITVTKGTSDVVLVLRDLDLTSETGATLSVNKGAEAKIIVSGSVKLTDNEDPTLEDVSDDYDGAAIKVKSGASAYLTGTGTLTVNGSAKNGVKVSAGDDGNGSLVIDGATININAANDAINAEYDLAILSGTLNISAGDDALHADRVLTVGRDGSGPSITVKTCTEGVEATVVNLFGGTVSVTSTDDGVNAANSDGTYADLGYSINVDGAKLTVNAPRADGLDSNGNINLISGSASIESASNGGDAGMDYDGALYVSESFELNNQSGVTSMGAMGGMMGGMQMNGQQGMMGGMPQNGQQAPTQGMSQTAPTQNQQGTAPTQGTNPTAPTQNQQNTQPQPFDQQAQNGMQTPTQGQAPFGNPGEMGQMDGMNQAPMQGQQGMMGSEQNGAPAMGGMNGQMGGMPGDMGGMNGQMSGMPGNMGGMNDQMGGMPGNMGGNGFGGPGNGGFGIGGFGGPMGR